MIETKEVYSKNRLPSTFETCGRVETYFLLGQHISTIPRHQIFKALTSKYGIDFVEAMD